MKNKNYNKSTSDWWSGFSIGWVEKTSPITLKKSFPRKGYPGLLARTIIRKSGCKGIIDLSCSSRVPVKKNVNKKGFIFKKKKLKR